jgi:hypothetical protein
MIGAARLTRRASEGYPNLAIEFRVVSEFEFLVLRLAPVLRVLGARIRNGVKAETNQIDDISGGPIVCSGVRL